MILQLYFDHKHLVPRPYPLRYWHSRCVEFGFALSPYHCVLFALYCQLNEREGGRRTSFVTLGSHHSHLHMSKLRLGAASLSALLTKKSAFAHLRYSNVETFDYSLISFRSVLMREGK